MLTGLTDKMEKRISEGSEIPDCISELEKVMLSAMGGTSISTRNKTANKKKLEIAQRVKHVCKVRNLNPTDGNIRRQYQDKESDK